MYIIYPSVRPRWAPCWPHEPCYQGCYGLSVTKQDRREFEDSLPQLVMKELIDKCTLHYSCLLFVTTNISSKNTGIINMSLNILLARVCIFIFLYCFCETQGGVQLIWKIARTRLQYHYIIVNITVTRDNHQCWNRGICYIYVTP